MPEQANQNRMVAPEDHGFGWALAGYGYLAVSVCNGVLGLLPLLGWLDPTGHLPRARTRAGFVASVWLLATCILMALMDGEAVRADPQNRGVQSVVAGWWSDE